MPDHDTVQRRKKRKLFLRLCKRSVASVRAQLLRSKEWQEVAGRVIDFKERK